MPVQDELRSTKMFHTSLKYFLIAQKGVPRFSHIVTSIIPISACTLEIAEWLENLGPWGSGMEEPKFIVPNSKISSFRRFGSNNEHASFYINDGSSKNGLLLVLQTMEGPCFQNILNEQVCLQNVFYAVHVPLQGNIPKV